MSETLSAAVAAVKEGLGAFCRFITANDVGTTGGHQAGFYIPKNVASLFFDLLACRGRNMERNIVVCWQGDFVPLAAVFTMVQRLGMNIGLRGLDEGFRSSKVSM